MDNLKLPPVEFNIATRHVKQVMKKVQFLDIETSLCLATVFRTGTQFIGMDDLESDTRILTVAGGSMYDLYTKGEKGIWAYGNHQNRSAFKEDPHDDRFVLEKVWKILDKADVVVAHNGRFDKGWILGRFLELGWKLPSRFSLVCTYQGLRDYNMTSKKLDYAATRRVGTRKITTDKELWRRCYRGERKAFVEMMEYNKGDIYDTLFKVYMNDCQYYPDKCVDMTNYELGYPQCRVTGHRLVDHGTWRNHGTGNEYYLYKNEYNGLIYRNRGMITKDGRGKWQDFRLVHHK